MQHKKCVPTNVNVKKKSFSHNKYAKKRAFTVTILKI